MGSRMATRTLRDMLSGLRQHPALPYYDNRVFAGKFPVMLARVVAANGTAATLHRTDVRRGQQGAGVCAEEIDGRQACCWGRCAPFPGNGAPPLHRRGDRDRPGGHAALQGAGLVLYQRIWLAKLRASRGRAETDRFRRQRYQFRWAVGSVLGSKSAEAERLDRNGKDAADAR